MKKLFAIIALVAFVGVNSYAQTASTDKKAPKKEEVKKCTEAERAACEKSGVKCETTDGKVSTTSATEAKTEKSCSKGASGSCCSKGTTSAGGSCCQKGGATGSTTEAAPAEKKKAKNKSVAMVAEPEKK